MYFWLTISLFAIVAGLASEKLYRNHTTEHFSAEKKRATERLQMKLVQQIPHLNRQQIKDLLSSQDVKLKKRIVIIDEQGQELLRRNKKLAHISPYLLSKPGPLIQDNANYGYRVLVIPPPKKHLLFSRGPGGTASRLFIAIILSAITSYFLARSISAPLTRLRQTSSQLAQGNLSIRTGGDVTSRKDEIGQLANDIDDMAHKLQQLQTSQTRLLTDVSHELRSPLARLQVALELAKDKQPGNINNEMNRIELESNRLEDLINQALTLLRDSSHLSMLKLQSLDLNELLQKLTNELNYESHHNNDPGIIYSGNQAVDCRVDEELIRRAIENILLNALRYTDPEKGVKLTLKTDNETIVITVRDYGPGIDPLHLAKIFDPFYRISESRDRDSGGYGMGLAIAHAAIKRLGGSIEAKNHCQSGLQLIIQLPLKTRN